MVFSGATGSIAPPHLPNRADPARRAFYATPQ